MNIDKDQDLEEDGRHRKIAKGLGRRALCQKRRLDWHRGIEVEKDPDGTALDSDRKDRRDRKLRRVWCYGPAVGAGVTDGIR
mgnify:CR=1 FL=1